MNNKGDIDWFIVTIVLSILTLVAFVLVAIFFPFQESIDRAACQQSVVLRAVLPSEGAGVSLGVKDVISLRCKVRNVCVTTNSYSKGNCTGLGKDFETMRLTAKTQLAKEEQIKMFLAREMADCWGMFGEGKLQIFAREFNSASFTSKGIICDKIEFDSTITGGENPIKEVSGFILYMTSHKVPNQNYSYMDYLAGTAEGKMASQLYGQQVVDKSISSLISYDSVSVTGVKSIFYIESTLTNFWQRIIGTAGGLGAAIGSLRMGGFGFQALTAGGYVVGSMGGDVLTRWLNDDTFCILKEGAKAGSKECKNHIGGLFLTDYNAQGFSGFNIGSFENL